MRATPPRPTAPGRSPAPSLLAAPASLCSGLFIISPTGILRQITINDLPVGRSVDETLRLVRAFQVCAPVGGTCCEVMLMLVVCACACL